MMTVSDIFDLWPSASDLARDIGLLRESHGTVMRHRGRIPVRHWPRLMEAAEKRGIEGLSYEVLVAAHAGKNSAHNPGCSNRNSEGVF